MPSLFPGMNPYLEQNDTWEDFHQRFMTHAADTLSGKVGARYLVKIEVRLYLHEQPAVDGERHSSLEIRDRRNRRALPHEMDQRPAGRLKKKRTRASPLFAAISRAMSSGRDRR